MDALEDFSNQFSDQMDSLKSYTPTTKDGRAFLPLIELFNNFLIQLDSKFTAFRDEMTKISSDRETKLAQIQEENNSLRKMLNQQNLKIDEKDQYTRRESLVFSGDDVPAFADDEITTDIVCTLVNAKLGDDQLHLIPQDISISHRLGIKPRNGLDNRRIIARFVRRNLKYQVLKAARAKKPANMYVSESLTPTRQMIVRAIHKMKKEHPRTVTKYYTNNGSITVQVKAPNAGCDDPAHRVTIDTMAALEEFSRKTFQKSTAAFLPTPRPRADRPAA